jgi:hypothetical protein
MSLQSLSNIRNIRLTQIKRKKNNSIYGVSGNSTPDNQKLLLLIYLAGLVVFACKLVKDLLELVILIIRNKNRESHIIMYSGLKTAGFSALKTNDHDD